MYELQDYMSYEIRCCENKKKAWLGQLYLFENIEKMNGERVMKVEVPKLKVHQGF